MKEIYKKIVGIIKKKAIRFKYPYMEFYKIDISKNYYVIFDADTGALFAHNNHEYIPYYLDFNNCECLEPELQILLKDLENAAI